MAPLGQTSSHKNNTVFAKNNRIHGQVDAIDRAMIHAERACGVDALLSNFGLGLGALLLAAAASSENSE